MVTVQKKKMWAEKTNMCKKHMEGKCAKGVYCTYMHCQEDKGDWVRDWESEGHKVEFCRYHYGLGNYTPWSCNKGQDCEWAHSEWDIWSRAKLKTKNKTIMWDKSVDKCSDDQGEKKKPSHVQPEQPTGRRRRPVGWRLSAGENVSANIAKALEDRAKLPANITGPEISATHGASSLPQSKEGEGPKNDSAESMQEEGMQTLEETVKGMRSKELTVLWRDNKLSCGIGHQCDPTPTTLPPLTMGRQLEAGLMNKEEAGEKESQAEEGAAAAEVITEKGSPNNVQQIALRRDDALKEVVEKEDYGEEEKVMSDTGLELRNLFTVKLFKNIWYGKEEGPQEAATKVAGLEAQEGAVAAAATEEEATRQSPSS